MFGLRQKLFMGFGGLLVILLVVGSLGIARLWHYQRELDQFLRENGRSIKYGVNMLDDLNALDAIARTLSLQRDQLSPMELNAVIVRAGDHLKSFNQNLNDEDNNVTLPGEDVLADDLNKVWLGIDRRTGKRIAGESYVDAFQTLLGSNSSSRDHSSAYATIRRLSPLVQSGADSVIQLNLNNMQPLEGHAKAMADSTTRAMILLSAIGVAVAVMFTMLVGRSILEPVKALTRSANQIEQGNLDLVVQVNSQDELRQLAEAFNSMAAKLREFRRSNRARLARTEETTQNAINSLPDAVAIVSPEGNVDMANMAAQRLFELHSGDQIAHVRTQWLRDLFTRVTRELRPIDARGYESAIQVLDESGERFFLPHAVPILDSERTLLGVTIVLADVTNLRRLDEMKSGMVSVVSHELKTPLTSIRMGVHLLLEERIGSLTSPQNDILVAMREDSDRLYRIIESLLDIDRIEAGRVLMDLKPLAVEPVVHETVEAMTAAFHDKGVGLTVDLPADVPEVMVDQSRIGHVMSNLLENALKYTPPGGKVRVSAEADGDFVRFTVSDTGSGIPRKYLDRIFDRFFRVPGQSGGTGAGLGLAIAREIVEAHGGKISVTGIEGQGSQFSFTLQRAGAGGTAGGDGAADQRKPKAVIS